MKHLWVACFLILATALTVACRAEKSSPETHKLEATLATLNLKDPGRDAAQNVLAGDFRPVGINGFACLYAGPRSDILDRLQTQHGLRCLAGTSDATESDRHQLLIEQATAYGVAYNLALLKLVSAAEPSNNSFKPNPLRGSA